MLEIEVGEGDGVSDDGLSGYHRGRKAQSLLLRINIVPTRTADTDTCAVWARVYQVRCDYPAKPAAHDAAV